MTDRDKSLSFEESRKAILGHDDRRCDEKSTTFKRVLIWVFPKPEVPVVTEVLVSAVFSWLSQKPGSTPAVTPFVRQLFWLVMCLMGLQSSPVLAGTTDRAAHFGISHAIATVTYMGVKKWTDDKPKALIWGVVAGLAAGTIKEVIIDKDFDSGDFNADLLGIGVAAGAIFIFDF